MVRIELVRHAKAMSRSDWHGADDLQRPLTDDGHTQAVALAEHLDPHGPVTLVSSPFTRCVQTLEPLARTLGTDVHTDEALGEASQVSVHDAGNPWVAPAWMGGRALGVVDRIARAQPEERTVVLCSHGDVIPALMATLAGRDGAVLEDCHLRKGARFTLTLDEGRCTQIVHVPPPEV